MVGEKTGHSTTDITKTTEEVRVIYLVRERWFRVQTDSRPGVRADLTTTVGSVETVVGRSVLTGT